MSWLLNLLALLAAWRARRRLARTLRVQRRKRGQ